MGIEAVPQTKTEDELAFLAGIASDPRDHFLRLVYADWLADHERYEDEKHQRDLAVGYEAIVKLELNPFVKRFDNEVGLLSYVIGNAYKQKWADIVTYRCCRIPEPWYFNVRAEDSLGNRCLISSRRFWLFFDTEIAALDEMALAFVKLTPDVRADVMTENWRKKT